MGNWAFAATVSEVWGRAIPAAPYPVAVGLAVQALKLPLEEANGDGRSAEFLLAESLPKRGTAATDARE